MGNSRRLVYRMYTLYDKKKTETLYSENTMFHNREIIFSENMSLYFRKIRGFTITKLRKFGKYKVVLSENMRFEFFSNNRTT